MKTKLLIFPSILLLTFIIAYLTLDYFNNQNQLLISRTRNIYIPGIELSIKLHNKLTETQRSFQDVVASSNELKLEKTDSIAKDLIDLCMLLSEKTGKSSFTDSILNLYTKYYKNAKLVTKAILVGNHSAELRSSIMVMREQYIEVEGLINHLEANSKNQASLHFKNIVNNNRKSAISNILIVISGLIISIFVSYFFSKVIAKPLRELNYELQASEEELRQMNEELATTNERMFGKNEELHTTLQKLKEMQSQLIQSEKMASVGMLISGIAHEINNPLNFITGGVSVINEHFSENVTDDIEKIQPFMNGIRVGVERISDIVSSLSHFSRNVDSNTEVCDIHSVIDNCLVILHNRLKHKVQINKEYNASSFIVIGNEGRLHQSFLNILVNAEQAIEKNGMITIITTVEQDIIKISIQDTGCGIKKENLAQITEPFFTTKAPGKGTGLGLAITCNIIKEHKGSLKYESELGKGTTAIIQLPVFR